MPDKELRHSLIAALLAGGLYIAVFGVGLSFLFLFLPTLPLFAVGLSRSPAAALAAALLAAAIVGVAGGGPFALSFLLLIGLPAWYLCRQSLRWRMAADGGHEWYPIGLAMLRLTLIGCIMVALMTAGYADQPGGLPQLLAQNVRDFFSGLPDEYAEAIDLLAQWSFLTFSLALWVWGIALYAHGWLAHKALTHRRLQLRPDFAIDIFPMPGWMLSLLAICALASLIGGESLGFLGKSTLITLLLPYFFLGGALLRRMSLKWHNRLYFLFFIYFVVLALFWPALIISGMGLFHHIKHLSAAGTSDKS